MMKAEIENVKWKEMKTWAILVIRKNIKCSRRQPVCKRLSHYKTSLRIMKVNFHYPKFAWKTRCTSFIVIEPVYNMLYKYYWIEKNAVINVQNVPTTCFCSCQNLNLTWGILYTIIPFKYNLLLRKYCIQ